MKEFKLIVAGGRDFDDYETLSSEILNIANRAYKDYGVSIVSGMARGADALAVRFAEAFGVKLYEFHADWNTFGKSAGYIRNKEMAEFSDALIAFWDGESKGTTHMIKTMSDLGKFVHVVKY